MNSNAPDARLSGKPDDAVNFVDLLREELSEIAKLRQERQWDQRDLTIQPLHVEEPDPGDPEPITPATAPPLAPADRIFKEAHDKGLVGLAFSGGGIRSATFNLGVLQGLADQHLLPMFDYLSTVSGGGYIGGWLESWIYRAAKDLKVAQCIKAPVLDQTSPIRRVQECLKPDRSKKIDHGESQAIRFLREYSNYLTPRLGFLGADTWTAVAIYLRNVILNQAILILFVSFLLLLPYLAVYFTQTLMGYLGPDVKYAPPIVAFLLILLAQCRIGWNMIHLTGDDRTGEFPPGALQGRILILVAAPIFLAAWCVSVWISGQPIAEHKWLIWLGIGLAGFALTWLVGAFTRTGEKAGPGQFWNSTPTRIKTTVCAVLSGLVGSLLLRTLSYEILYKWTNSDSGIWHVVSFGTPLVVLVFLLVAVLQLGLMGRLSPDPRREWWGRLGGWLFIITIVWTGLFALAIYSPLAVLWSRKFFTYAGLLWVLNTATGVLGGKNGKTGSLDSISTKDIALSVTPYVFIVGLAAGLATLLEIALADWVSPQDLADFLKTSQVGQKVESWIVSLDWILPPSLQNHAQATFNVTSAAPAPVSGYVEAHWRILSALMCQPTVLIFAVIIAVLCLFLAWRVDLNQFSMNLFYRNRLVRCYLGASHRYRHPNPFTGFDPGDDLPLKNLQSSNGYEGPFPVVNTALNLVKGQNLAWQERKAEPFVMTPLRCGFDTWMERLDLDDESPKLVPSGIEKYGFRPTEFYAYPPNSSTDEQGGLRLGAAISISGAAASPNMGYHSVPSLAALMTFFNVRLGFWSGNPRNDITWKKPGPTFGLFQLLAELFGLTDDEAPYVYLSDGGHFENLGLYELIKRRCQYIVVCDADSDGAYAFGDLANAIRKCREDIGVEIILSADELTPGKSSPSSGVGAGSVSSSASSDNYSQLHFAIGTIRYDLVDPDAKPGILVYIKTSLTGDEPADVLNYHREHPDFPHQTTANQWFTESQFESYRRLGQHIVESLFNGMDHIGERTTSDIFESLQAKWQKKDASAAAD